MVSRNSYFSISRRSRPFAFKILQCLQSYVFLFDNGFTLGLFTSAATALFCHKILILVLHRPLSISGLVFAWPFLFVFDFITIMLLYHGLASTKIAWRVIAGIVAVFIISLSGMFASLYFEANAELNWGRSTNVLTNVDEANFGGVV
jgi:hypothetical protein